MDTDLADAVGDLKEAFEKRGLPCLLQSCPKETVDSLKRELRLPPRYAAFLAKADPVNVESETPIERVRLLPASELAEAQSSFDDWKKEWVVIGESALLGDPYFFDVKRIDPEGDCPVMTAMSGQDKWTPILAASTFAQFLRILATTMEVASGFGDAIMDDEDEDTFRETLVPKIKVIDAVALRAGHWT